MNRVGLAGEQASLDNDGADGRVVGEHGEEPVAVEGGARAVDHARAEFAQPLRRLGPAAPDSDLVPRLQEIGRNG